MTCVRAVAGEPLRESAHRQVLETYLAVGNTGEAIRHFDESRHLLRAASCCTGNQLGGSAGTLEEAYRDRQSDLASVASTVRVKWQALLGAPA
ncbi:BTAD domain-containing putative transcriptional regulator [Streptomyces sp. NPDC087843]|uniref:BTAD domain-containing putative transcriptional regulator n=1 Tax=Streptomyces sp. NPDC087843 TaxID=3365804 RepID=UPI003821913F